jgi:hypothetical protein
LIASPRTFVEDSDFLNNRGATGVDFDPPTAAGLRLERNVHDLVTCHVKWRVKEEFANVGWAVRLRSPYMDPAAGRPSRSTRYMSRARMVAKAEPTGFLRPLRSK